MILNNMTSGISAKTMEHKQEATEFSGDYNTLSNSWLVYVLIVLVTLTSFALVEVPSLRKWSGCERKTCMQVVAGAKNITLITTYVVTLAIYGITGFGHVTKVPIYKVHHDEEKNESVGELRQSNTNGPSRSNTSTRSHIKSDEKVVDRRASLPLSVIDVCPSRSESVTRR
ncbi:hypothetical protein Tcan_16701 [Toxocara canis]|uniref:Uncharacterized protein n=1 Tax=Toxocara canis TaxID=6265 RepID=A0A0B2VGU9_TOXCA|nr:hypothetical protein Tcan_16701 [Toxocara canis]